MLSGFSWRTVIFVLQAIIAFYMSTWEEYHTGVLYLGVVNGPTEGLLACCALMAYTGWAGPQIWHLSVNDSSAPLPSLIASLFPTTWKVIDVVAFSMFFLLVTFGLPAK